MLKVLLEYGVVLSRIGWGGVVRTIFIQVAFLFVILMAAIQYIDWASVVAQEEFMRDSIPPVAIPQSRRPTNNSQLRCHLRTPIQLHSLGRAGPPPSQRLSANDADSLLVSAGSRYHVDSAAGKGNLSPK
jgi:hypothetical protein